MSELTVTQIAVNFPNLKELTLESSSSIKFINLILQDFPKLQLLNWVSVETSTELDVYTFPDGLSHKNLKSLKLGTREFISTSDLMKLIGCIVKLENLHTMFDVNEQTFIEILKLQPKLKSLTLDYLTYDKDNSLIPPKTTRATLNALKEHGKNLGSFRYCCFVFGDGIYKEMVKEEFKDRFKNVKFWGHTEWIMNNL